VVTLGFLLAKAGISVEAVAGFMALAATGRTHAAASPGPDLPDQFQLRRRIDTGNRSAVSFRLWTRADRLFPTAW